MKLKLFVLFVFICTDLLAQFSFEESVVTTDDNWTQGVYSVFSSDIDGDGDIDIISASRIDNKITWFENKNGQLDFANSSHIISNNATYAISVYASDLDNDGDIDVISASKNDNKIAWYENIDGLGTFGPEILIDISNSEPFAVVSLDIDNDGDKDVLSSVGQGIVWYENLDGFGNFGPARPVYNGNDNWISIGFSDLDNDGDMDIMSASANNNKFSWFENLDGLGNFGSQNLISDQIQMAASPVAADIDNDGDMDLFVASYSSIVWFENSNGLGNFENQQVVSTELSFATSLIVSDIDGDGNLDVISASKGDNVVAWYKNTDGLGTFGFQNIIFTGPDAFQSIHSTDLDGDGDIDVISAGIDTLAWYENTNGLGFFGSQSLISTCICLIRDATAADLDNDGDLDLISAANKAVVWYENLDGLGTFGTQKKVGVTFNAVAVHAADIDSDGDLDILFTSSFNDDKVAWFANNGSGEFGDEQVISVSVDGADQVLTMDIDGDGDLDVVASGFTGDRAYWFENIDGQGNFGSGSSVAFNADGLDSIGVSDLDGDGDLDVVVAAQYADAIYWYPNNGSGFFSPRTLISQSQNGPKSLKIADIDGDGDDDIVVASGNDDKIVWYENTFNEFGGVPFSAGILITNSANGVLSIDVADIDNDNDLDIVAASLLDNKLSVYPNLNGLGFFGTEQIISLNSERPLHVFSADINNDGYLDIVASSQVNNKISWFNSRLSDSNYIQGTVFGNFDNNGCDNSDYTANLMLTADDGINTYSTFSSNEGRYNLIVSEGNFTTYVAQVPNFFTSIPLSHESNFIGTGTTDDYNFCIDPIGVHNDLNISVYPYLENPRPGVDTQYKIIYKNVGTSTLSGTIDFDYSINAGYMDLVAAIPSVDTDVNSLLTWSYTNLQPFESREIIVIMSLNSPTDSPPLTGGENIGFVANIHPTDGDETTSDNNFQMKQVLVNSYDPNDINVLEGPEILYENADKYLHYIIRFQNTGTANAINVRINNILDDKFNWNTLQLESLSHNGRVEIINGNDIDFIFDFINLPDSTSNEPSSHGYVAYKIKPKQDVVLGDVFNNTADIYFDLNLPITTNTASTVIVNTLSVEENELQNVLIYPNPTKNKLHIKALKTIAVVDIYNLLGQQILTIKPNSLTELIDLSGFNSGMYIVKIKIEERTATYKIIKE